MKGNAEALRAAMERCDRYHHRDIRNMSARRINEVVGKAFRFVVYGEGEPPALKGVKRSVKDRKPPQHYVDCAARGLSMAETARELGVSRWAVSCIARRYPELRFADGNAKRWAAE